MSVRGIGHDPSTLYSLNNLQSQTSVNSAGNTDSDGDGGTSQVKRHHHGGNRHGGGEVGQALAQALQSLGLNLTQSPSSNSANASTDANSDGSATNHGQIQSDIRHFMHALFDAVRSEASNASGTPTHTGAGNGNRAASFSSGLAALISQIGSGSAPSDLQKAFDQLAADLQGGTSTSTSTSSSSSSSSSSDTSTADAASSTPSEPSAVTGNMNTGSAGVTLQALLTALQTQLNTYGQNHGSSASLGLLATA